MISTLSTCAGQSVSVSVGVNAAGLAGGSAPSSPARGQQGEAEDGRDGDERAHGQDLAKGAAVYSAVMYAASGVPW